MPRNTQKSGGTVTTEKSAGEQALGVVQIVAEILWLFIQITYYNLLAIYKVFVPPPPKSVAGDIVLVTGAGHGIGKEIALQYASLGATVVAWDINAQNNAETVKEIQKRGYPKAYSYVCDVSNREKVFEVVEQVKKDVGEITIIVNNAGIMPTHSLLDHTKEEIERTFGINVFAHFWIIQAILPSMLKNNNGHIVSISSVAGFVGAENLVPYCGTKFAVRGYMEALFHEIDSNPKNRVKLTTICPFMVDTGLCKKPKMRFDKSLSMLSPQFVAEQAVDAQRRNYREVSIPGHFLISNNVVRTWSINAGQKLKEFVDTGLDSDLL